MSIPRARVKTLAPVCPNPSQSSAQCANTMPTQPKVGRPMAVTKSIDQSHTYTHCDPCSGRETVTMTGECADECSTPGQDAFASVHHWWDRVTWHASPNDIRKYLKRSGGWDAEEIENMDNIQLHYTYLWCAACDIREDPDMYA